MLILSGCNKKSPENEIKTKNDSKEEFIMANNIDTKGVILKSTEDGCPVILAISKGNYTAENIRKFPQLIIIAWKYDGSQNNGMPPKEVNERMIIFEEALEKDVIGKGYGIHAVSRTGNNLKEFEYYFAEQAEFMEQFNQALLKFERFPIDIKFYKDSKWEELKSFIDRIKPIE